MAKLEIGAGIFFAAMAGIALLVALGPLFTYWLIWYLLAGNPSF